MNRRDFLRYTGLLALGTLFGNRVLAADTAGKPGRAGTAGRPLTIRGSCVACGGCIASCPVNALELPSRRLVVDEAKCIRCGNCVKICPVGAPELTP